MAPFIPLTNSDFIIVFSKKKLIVRICLIFWNIITYICNHWLFDYQLFAINCRLLQ